MNRLSPFKITLVGALWLVVGPAVWAAEPPVHIRGTVVSATATDLTVKTGAGDVSLAIDSTTRIAGVVPSSLEQIKEGSFVGIANMPGARTSSALEVVVFPESMKGAGLGDYPWDLAPKNKDGAAQSSAMTNGTVKSSMAASSPATGSAMTNGTVKKTESSKGLVLTVDYGKGEKTIRVPTNVPVVGIVPADASKLLPGAHVFVSTKADAPKNAAFVAVGIDGTVPPM